MTIIYNVTIEPTEKQNHFHITWHNIETNTKDFFDQTVDMTQEEVKILWRMPGHQLAIGEKLFYFLDGDSRHLQQALNQADQKGQSLQVNLRTCKQINNWPFELLARDGIFLLPHKLHLVRCVSNWGIQKKTIPQNRPLKLLFMACSAIDVEPTLYFEREEEAIFHITRDLTIEMEVEDSGSLQGLRQQLEREQYDVVHMSCHANINKQGRPYIIMENETGYQQKIFPEQLWQEALIENPPRLLFLSGSRTGEAPVTPDTLDTTNRHDSSAAVSFARLLVESDQVPAVLGWGRSVSDEQAIHAGEMFYHELSRGKSILDALQRTRYELIKDFSSDPNPSWPLLHLFSSGMELNVIVQEGQQLQPKPRQMKHVFLEQSQVQVLAEGFVGRRRQLQTSLRVLKQDFKKVGILLLGTGGLGKSCLAGKISERFPRHTLIIVHGKLNAITLEAAIEDAFIAAQNETGKHILSQKKRNDRKIG